MVAAQERLLSQWRSERADEDPDRLLMQGLSDEEGFSDGEEGHCGDDDGVE